MLSNKLFQKLHYFLVFILLIMFVFLPLKYIKYIAWIPIAVVIQWFIFDGCVLDNLHTSDRSGNCASCLKLFNTKIANYIITKYQNNSYHFNLYYDIDNYNYYIHDDYTLVYYIEYNDIYNILYL